MQGPQSDVYLASGLGNSRPPAKYPKTSNTHLWNTRRAQPLAELSQAERSEAQPREARPPPKAAGAVRRPGAEGDPRASRGPQTKAGMRLGLEANKHGANQHPAVGGKACSARTGLSLDNLGHSLLQREGVRSTLLPVMDTRECIPNHKKNIF